MTPPDPEVPLVYSLHYDQQGLQGWQDELPTETMAHMKKREKGKSNLHAKEDFSEKLESMNLDPRRSKLIQKYQEVFRALPPPLSCKNEAVPRTPWPGYGIQPVSGPLTPCTACSVP